MTRTGATKPSRWNPSIWPCERSFAMSADYDAGRGADQLRAGAAWRSWRQAACRGLGCARCSERNGGAQPMSRHGYESGRLNLPFVGHCTFGKQPICTDWDNIAADVAVLGVPYDMGTQYRSGARFGPRAIREASTLFSFGHDGAYDHEDDAVYLPRDAVRIVDMGDADIVHTDTATSHANTEKAVDRKSTRLNS